MYPAAVNNKDLLMIQAAILLCMSSFISYLPFPLFIWLGRMIGHLMFSVCPSVCSSLSKLQTCLLHLISTRLFLWPSTFRWHQQPPSCDLRPVALKTTPGVMCFTNISWFYLFRCPKKPCIGFFIQRRLNKIFFLLNTFGISGIQYSMPKIIVNK